MACSRISRVAEPHDRPHLLDQIEERNVKTDSPAQESRTLGSTSRRYHIPSDVALDECVIFYIGEEGLGLTNLLMTHPNNEVRSTLLPHP